MSVPPALCTDVMALILHHCSLVVVMRARLANSACLALGHVVNELRLFLGVPHWCAEKMPFWSLRKVCTWDIAESEAMGRLFAALRPIGPQLLHLELVNSCCSHPNQLVDILGEDARIRTLVAGNVDFSALPASTSPLLDTYLAAFKQFASQIAQNCRWLHTFGYWRSQDSEELALEILVLCTDTILSVREVLLWPNLAVDDERWSGQTSRPILRRPYPEPMTQVKWTALGINFAKFSAANMVTRRLQILACFPTTCLDQATALLTGLTGDLQLLFTRRPKVAKANARELTPFLDSLQRMLTQDAHTLAETELNDPTKKFIELVISLFDRLKPSVFSYHNQTPSRAAMTAGGAPQTPDGTIRAHCYKHGLPLIFEYKRADEIDHGLPQALTYAVHFSKGALGLIDATALPPSWILPGLLFIGAGNKVRLGIAQLSEDEWKSLNTGTALAPPQTVYYIEEDLSTVGGLVNTATVLLTVMFCYEDLLNLTATPKPVRISVPK